jgi:hypothetical protein
MGAKRVVFENLAHDFPQRVLYWIDDDGQLRARVEGTVDGRQEAEDYAWRRGALAP